MLTLPWPIWALCRNREIRFLPLWDWHPVQPINGRRCCGCRLMPDYLFTGRYTGEAIKGMIDQLEDRTEA
jgi:hypothetical protein